MMKRLPLLVLICLFGLLSLSVVSAFDMDADGIHRLANYMPDNIELFLAMDISNKFFTDFDSVMEKVTENIPLTYPTELRNNLQDFSSRFLFHQSLSNEFDYWGGIYPWLGRYIGVGADTRGLYPDTFDMEIWVVFEIVDQKGMHEALLDGGLSESAKLVSTGDVIAYEIEDVGTLALTDSLLIISSLKGDIFDVAPLSKKPEFRTSITALQEDTYNGLLYVSQSLIQDILKDSSEGDIEALNLSYDGWGAITLGLTLSDDDTIIVDLSLQTVTPAIAPPISTDMLGGLPASADLLIAGTDFNILFDTTLDLMRASAESADEADPTLFLNIALNYGSLDFEDDFLSWATGTYVMFAGNDLLEAFQDISFSGNLTNIHDLVWGVAFEATDPDTMVTFVEHIIDVADTLGDTTDEIHFKTVTLEGKPALILFVAPDAEKVALEQLLLVPMDDFLYFGTVNGYEEIVAGNTLDTTPDFIKGADHILSSSNSMTYLNAEWSVILVAAAIMAADAPDYDVLRTIQGKQFTPESVTDTSYLDLFDWMIDSVSNMTFTTRVHEDGIVLMRLTASVKD